MKSIICLILLFFSVSAAADDRADLLKAWEDIQKSGEEVAIFEKITDGKYKIKFTKLPYDGELVVLAYDIEDIAFGDAGKYEKMGYLEVDLPNADDELMSKYGRMYYKWAQNNTLYLNRETGKWDSSKDYTESLMVDAKKYEPSTFTLLFLKYWNYLLAIIIIYFVFSQIINTRRVKESIALQNKAADDMEKSKAFMQESLEISQKTNDLLGNILAELKNRP